MKITPINYSNYIHKQTPLKTNPVNFKGAFFQDDYENLPPTEYWRNYYLNNQYYWRTYENPVTKEKDEKIKTYESELAEKHKNNIGNMIAYSIAYTSVNKKTGEIDPIAKYITTCLLAPRKGPFEYPLQEKISDYRNMYYIPSVEYNSLPYLLEAMKDKEGNFPKENLEFVETLVTNQIEHKNMGLDLKTTADLLIGSKDKNGIVYKNMADKVVKMYGINNDEIIKNINTLSKFPADKRDNIFNFCTGLFEIKNYNYTNFSTMAEFCFDKQGNKIKDKAKLAKEIAQKQPYYKIDGGALEYAYYSDDFKEVYFMMSEDAHSESARKIIGQYLDGEGKLPAHTKQKMQEYLSVSNDLINFPDIYTKCHKEDKTFDDELFKNTLTLIDSLGYLGVNCVPNYHCFDIANNALNTEYMLLEVKIKYLNWLDTLINDLETDSDLAFPALFETHDKLQKELFPEEVSLPIKKESKNDIIQKVFRTNGKNEPLTEFESTITKSIPTLKRMKNGLPLKYSRKKFLKDLTAICQENPNAEKIIREKMGMNLLKDSNGNITGYNNILILEKLNKENELEKKLYDCAYKFMYENEVKSQNKELNEYLNYIISAFPEFINIIGKQQHSTHKYTLDVHSLLVLAESIKNPKYQTHLNKEDKITLMATTLFHDIAKEENNVDKAHPFNSANRTRGIIKKIFPDRYFDERIYDLIANHNFLEKISDGDKLTKQQMAFNFRRPNDFEIAKIIAEADLKSVSDEFYSIYQNALTSVNTKDVNRNINYINSWGNALSTSKIIYPKKAQEKCKKTINGEEYTIINLHEISDNEDMGKYGFQPGLKKKDLRFLVHMTNKFDSLEVVDSSIDGGLFSESLISPKKSATYGNYDYGVILSQKNYNIINGAKENQCSGNAKGINGNMRLLFDDLDRFNFRKGFLNYLKLDEYDINSNDFASFYNNVLSNGKINIDEEYAIGEYKFTGKQILRAIKLYQNSLLKDKRYGHNEIIGYKPQIEAVIAFENTEYLSHSVLDFAKRNNLPIIMM